MGRKLRDVLPSYYITPRNSTQKRNLQEQRVKQKNYFDQNNNVVKPEEFRQGQKVAVQHHATKEWSIKGAITHKFAPRSYEIQLNNNTFIRRNTKNIRKVYAITSYSSNPNEEEQLPQNLDVNYDSDVTTAYNEDDSDSDDTINNDDSSDSDNTIPYKDDIESDEIDETIYGNKETNEYTTITGRKVKRKMPTDYDDL